MRRTTITSKWHWLLQRLLRRLWVRASIFCMVGIATALVALWARDLIPDDFSRKVGAETVDTILHILATSMLAVTTFSLSTLVAAYTAASSSATPRATRLLLEDRTAQNALSTFIGSFLYSLVGIIALKIGVYGDSGRLVLFVVTLGVILFIVGMLLQWVDHLSTLGRVGETIDMVERATQEAVAQHTELPCLGGKPLKDFEPKRGHHGVLHPAIGYVQHVDMQQLSELAKGHDMEFWLLALPGTFNDSQTPLLYASKKLDEELCAAASDAFTIDGERSFDQDPRYGFVVLSEIASRALSPAVNDQGTAIDVIGTGVRLLAPWLTAKAPEEEPPFAKVHVADMDFADVMDDLFTPIARSGAGVVEVGVRLQKAFASLEGMAPKTCKPAIRKHSKLALERALAALTLDEDKARLKALALS